MENNAAGAILSREAAVFVVAVCDCDRAKKIMGLFRNRGELFSLATLGQGTANSKILNYLGLGETEKTVLFSVMPVSEAREVLAEGDRRLDLKKPGHGIIFTMSLEGRNGGKECMKECIKKVEESGTESVSAECAYRLVVAAVNRGYTEEVMDAARSAKATGGTVIHARKFGVREEKFFKVSIQPEQEMLFILVEVSKKDAVTAAIMEKAGPGTPAGATVISIPVCDVLGLQTSPLSADELESSQEQED